MTRPKVFSIKDPVFKTEPLFVLGCTATELEWLLKRRYRLTYSVDPESCGTMITLRRSPWRIVWTLGLPRSPKDIACLMHELLHLVTRICGDKGIPIHHHISTGECGDEAAAYLFEYFAVTRFKRLHIGALNRKSPRSERSETVARPSKR